MNVETILKKKGHKVVAIPADATLKEAADLLSEKKIGAAVVADGKKLGGILSERDIVRAISKFGAAVLDKPVRETMTQNVITCSRADTVDHLMGIMTGGRFRHVPVVEEGEMIGLISIGDVVKYKIAETEMEAEQLKMYIATG